MKLFSALLIALLIAAAPFARAAGSVPEVATPPLWVVERDGKTLYLFGSLHLLPPETKWDRAEIQTARKRSTVFVFETPLNDGASAMRRVVETSGMLPPGKMLKEVLSPKLYSDLEEAAWRVQYPVKLLAPFRPWLAGVYLELNSYLKLGFSTYYGVDHLIEEEAKKRGAELAYLETIDQQLSYFSKLGGRSEIAYLSATVKSILEEPESPIDLVKAWASADVGELVKLLDKGFAEVPALRSQLLVERNRAWVPQLRAMLASEKTHFVTVGAGHLVGRDSVIAMLRARGYKITGP
jgi:hypothetical protein